MSAVPKQPEQADGIADLRSVDLTARVTISKAPAKTSKSWRSHEMALKELLDWISSLQTGDKGQGEVWAPATFDGWRRVASAALGTDLIILDADAGHPLAELKAKILDTGWYARIIPSSSWGATETEASEDHYDAWVKEQADAHPNDLAERYLIEQLRKTPEVARGATVLKRRMVETTDAQGRRSWKASIWFGHNRCEKYRIVCVLAQRCDLSTLAARKAWKQYYAAVVDRIGLPLDISCGSPERMFFLSYLSPDRLKPARDHQVEIHGGHVDLSALPPAPEPRERTRRGRVGARQDHVRVDGGEGRERDQASGDEGRERDRAGGAEEPADFVRTDPDTDRMRNLEVLAAKGLFQHLQLADILQENGWPQDDRGEVDGKFHIQCPFAGEHSTVGDGGTFAWNASDHKKTGLSDLQPGAGIICNHNACRDRDRLEFLAELLRKGGLKTADLEKARVAARDARAADDFEPIEPDVSDPPPPTNRPTVEWVQWLRERMEIKAGHVCEPRLHRLRAENPKSYYEVCLFWDSQEPCPDDIPPGVERAGMNMFGWRLLPEFFDPNHLPDRPWVVEGRLMSGYMTLGSAAPGVGKSNFALLTAISIATGISLTGETIVRQGRVLVHNNEDDFIEMQRRFAGICKHHRIDFDRARENLVFSSGEFQRLVLAIMRGGMVESDPKVSDFIRELKKHGITHVVLDPLVSLQKGVPEIDNSAMDEVAYIIRRIAHDADVSIDLIHHNVKEHTGDSEKRAGDQNAARGGAIIGAARSTYTLSRMSKTTAKEYDIALDQAGAYMRLDGAKANYSAHAGAPIWFKTQSVNIRDDPSELTPLISATGEPLEDKEVPRRPPLTVGVHELWIPPDRQAVEAPTAAQAEKVKQDKRDKQIELLRLVAEAMPSDRCNVSNVLDAVRKQRGVGDTTARSLVKKAVLAAELEGELFLAVEVGGRKCSIRIEKDDHVKNGPLWLVRDWDEPKSDD